MDNLIIRGGRPLGGEIDLPAAKNSVLPIIAASILTEEKVIIHNCPHLSDITNMLDIIRSLGGKATLEENTLVLDNQDVASACVSSALTGGIRSSIFILGPILGRLRTAAVSYPGGCEIGLRPIDLHLGGLRALGIEIAEEGGMIHCDGKGLRGGTVNLDFPSVGATENIMMAAVLAEGRTVIRNAAREPEIVDLQGFLNRLGARVHGAGSGVITVEGVKRLGGGEYLPLADRIVAGTYLTACAACGGDVTVHGICPDTLSAVLAKLGRTGCDLLEYDDRIRIRASGRVKAIGKTETQVYPGFPTDMQAQLGALLSTSDGVSILVENIFENRFKYTVQLRALGADITVKDRTAVIHGVKRLRGAFVTAEDLRGGAALVIAGLAAEGQTIVRNVRHIDRGYESIEDAFARLGADIKRGD